MSRKVRVCLLAGCCVIATLEARRATETLSAGISGPYAAPTPARDLRAELRDAASLVSPAPILLFGPADTPIAGWGGRGRR